MQIDQNRQVRRAGPIDSHLSCLDDHHCLRVRHSLSRGSSTRDSYERSSSSARSLFPAWALSIMLTGLGTMVSGCSTNSSDLVHLPDGQTGFAINCSGAGSGSNWGECYQKAGDACGASGYDIISKDNDDGATAGGGVANVATANVKSRSMVVRCK